MRYEIKSYPDGTKYVILGEWTEELVYKINTYEDLWLLSQINDILKHREEYTTLVIPNLLDAQADRRFAENQPHSLKLVCEFLNNLKQFKHIKIFHPHNAEVVEALIDRVEIIDNFEFIEDVLADLLSNYDQNSDEMESKLILMSSDAGGYKPLMKLADKLKWEGETFAASKSRSYTEVEGTKLSQIIDRQDFQGKDILIIDDINVYGGTFKGLSKLLKERNCGKLFLAVSHMTIQYLGEDPVTNYFDKVFTTNSKFNRYAGNYVPYDDRIVEPKNLEIIKLW